MCPSVANNPTPDPAQGTVPVPRPEPGLVLVRPLDHIFNVLQPHLLKRLFVPPLFRFLRFPLTPLVP